MQHVHDDDLPPAFKMLARVGRVQSHLTESWETLATMTPADYMRFRHTLGTASGLQSHQYRLIEFLLGAKDPGMLEMALAASRPTPSWQRHRPRRVSTMKRCSSSRGAALPFRRR